MGVFEFTWPHQAGEVLLTGTFDNWRGSIKLQKNESGLFTGSVDLGDAEKVYYKYIVDGCWTTNYDAKREYDSSGNENNVLYPEDLKTPTPSLKERSVVPNGMDTPPMTPVLDELPGGFPETPALEEKVPDAQVSEPAILSAEPPVLPPVVTPADEREAHGTGVLDIPEIVSPEPEVVEEEVESVAPEAPVAEPTEKLPEPQAADEEIPAASVPEIVKESQAIAQASPEASADETLVEKKIEVEQELIAQPPVLEHTEVEERGPVVAVDDETPVPAAPETTTAVVETENQPPVTNGMRSVSPTMSPLTTPATPTTHVYTASVPGATFKKGEPAPSTRSSSASSHESHNEKRELFKEKSPEKKKEKRRSAILGRILNLFK